MSKEPVVVIQPGDPIEEAVRFFSCDRADLVIVLHPDDPPDRAAELPVYRHPGVTPGHGYVVPFDHRLLYELGLRDTPPAPEPPPELVAALRALCLCGHSVNRHTGRDGSTGCRDCGCAGMQAVVREVPR